MARERAVVQTFLETRPSAVLMRVLRSEDPRFPISLTSLADADAYQLALDAVSESNVVVLLLGSRYGGRVHRLGGVSMTHAEYREAYRRRIPVLTFLNEDTWFAYQANSRGETQEVIPASEIGIFDFIREIGGSPRKKWIFFWRTIDDIVATLDENLFNFDSSRFVADVTYPDDDEVHTGERFEKIWELQNTGMVGWVGRQLKEKNPSRSGLVPDQSRVTISDTMPGEHTQISVWFTAPKYPGTYKSIWKMVDKQGSECFPWTTGIWIKVHVRDR